MKRTQPLSPLELSQLRDMKTVGGHSERAMARRFGITTTEVRKLTRLPRRRKLKPNEVAQDLLAGLTVGEIAEKYKVSPSAVSQHIRQHSEMVIVQRLRGLAEYARESYVRDPEVAKIVKLILEWAK